MAKGMDTKTDPKQLVMGKMELLENAYLISPGRFKKRNGYESLGVVENPNALAGYGDEVLAIANNKVYSYSAGKDGFVSVKTSTSSSSDQSFEFCQVETYRGITNGYSMFTTSSAYHESGFIGIVSDSLSASWFSILDYQTKAVIYGPVQIQTGSAISTKVFTLGAYFLIVYTSSTNIKYIAVPANTTSGALPSSVTIASNYDTTNKGFDADVLNGVLYLVWSATTSAVGIASLDSSLALRTSTLSLSDTVTGSIAIAGDETTGDLSIAYYNGSAVKYLQCNISFTITSGPSTVETVNFVKTVALIINNNSGYIYYEVYSNVSLPSFCFYNNRINRSTITSGTAAAGASWVRSVGIVSRPFYATVNGETSAYIFAGYTGNQPAAGQGCVFLLNQSGVVISNISPGNAYGIGIYTRSVAERPNVTSLVNRVSSTEFNTCFLRANYGFSIGGDQYSNFGAFGLTINFDSQYSYASSSAANNCHIVGGSLQMYDGRNVVEHGFNIIAEPPISGVASYNGSTNNFPTGTYSYIIVYEWFDSQGNFHQGVPSVAFDVAVTGPQTTITLTIPTLRLTQKNNVYLSVYRNTLSSPSLFNRVYQTPNADALNTTSADSISYADSVPDATIATYQPIYTTGGVVPNYCVPSPRVIAKFKNRLLVVPAETPNIIWISKEITQGIPGVPVEFSAFLTIQVNTEGGDITALVQMDDKCVVFKMYTLFYFAGDGPNDTLTSDDISEPTEIPTDVGCTNQRSVVVTPVGVMFKSQKGIYLLDRSLSASYVGAEVEAYNNETIVSADLIPNTQQVRFLLDSGTCLVYDYLMKEWFIYTNHNGVDAVIYNGLYTYLGTNGKLLQETPNEFSDDGSFITMKLRTGWLSFAGIQGFQRVWKMNILGEYYSSHQLLVSLAYNFDPNIEQTVQFDLDDVYDNGTYGESTPYGDEDTYGSTYPLEQFTIYPDIQKCESIQVTIEDVSNGTNGESLSISSLGFEVGVEGGLNRLPASNKFG